MDLSADTAERAARKLAEMWPDDFDPARRGSPNVRAFQVARAVLEAPPTEGAVDPSGYPERIRIDRATASGQLLGPFSADRTNGRPDMDSCIYVRADLARGAVEPPAADEEPQR